MSDQEWPPGPEEGSGPAGSPDDTGGAPPPPPTGGTPPPPPPPPSQPPGPQGAASPTGAGQSADLGIRFGARVIDSVLLFIVNAIITAVIIFGFIFSDVSGGASPVNFGFSVGSLIASIVSLAITLGYFVFLETTRGATVGKMLLNLEVRNTGGSFPTPEQSLKRNSFYVLAIIPFVGWLLQLAAVIYIAVTINQNAANRGWHDDFGETVVVKTA